MTPGQPTSGQRTTSQHLRRLTAGALGLQLGTAAVWLLLATASAASAGPRATPPALPPSSGSPSPTTSTPAPTGSPTRTSTKPSAPHPSRTHRHSPTPSAQVVVPSPSSAPPEGLGAPVVTPGRAPDAGSAPRPGRTDAILAEPVHPPDPALGGMTDGWWLPGSAARPLIVRGTAALIVAVAGLLAVGRRRRQF